MNISIKATNTTLTPGMRENIESKLQVLEKFSRPEDKIHVELEEDAKHSSGEISRVEINVQPHGYYAESTGGDFYEALDLAVPKIKNQMSKVKDKDITLRKRIGKWFKRGE
jgi:ribosomal subunit interface protein